jgi:hypothetical protein
MRFRVALVLLLLASTRLSTGAPVPTELVIEISSPTGRITHGAAGWLYGQAAPGIPTINMMEPLYPQVSAQKPPDGLQHPMGDAMLVAPGYFAAGGKRMQIYMQDIYSDWPYNDLGLQDYLKKVDLIAHRIAADPHRDRFVYVPFNEPDNNWYGYTGEQLERFLQDWRTVYREIRSIDATAKIAGPGFEHYRSATYLAFLKFAKDNQVLPDQLTWHELHDDFFSEWYARYNDYRAIEKGLGIGPIPIVINEYARNQGDLSVPGNLIQWIARLEDSKVEGCLAFWTPSGTLADLTARIWPNRPTGAWWLYRWYGAMTGDTLKVEPPDRNAQGLQGIASLDGTTKQIRVLFGGASGPMDIAVDGLDALSDFGGGVHVSMWEIANSGIEPSTGPEDVMEKDYPAPGSKLVLRLARANRLSGYYAILTPSREESGEPGAQANYPAIYADLAGSAVPSYRQPMGPAVALNGQSSGSVRFVTQVDRDGYYLLRLHYAIRSAGAPNGAASSLGLVVDEEKLPEMVLTPSGSNSQMEVIRAVFLSAGIHLVKVETVPRPEGRSVELHSLDVLRTQGQMATYAAGSEKNSFGYKFLQFNSVMADAPGHYRMIVTYSNSEIGHKGQVDVRSEVSVNDLPPHTFYFRNTFNPASFSTSVIDIDLKSGANSIRFSYSPGEGPVIEQIQIAQSEIDRM